ncbi:hypothetical protein G9A89_018115 [Geosiphon pyriformis]|nr:hypothetical protein G9A89_018115 [Geosiphon pyriformis]
MTTAYIAKIPEFTGEDNDTSSQEWLDKVQKAEDANAPQPIQQQYQQLLPIQQYQTPLTQQYQVPARRLVQHNQFTPQNQFQYNNNRINPNNQLVLQNSGQQRPNYYHTQPSYLTIPEESDFQQPAFSENIFSFEFEANESPFLLSNAAANEQKAITVMYTEATLQITVNRPAQTVIVTADSIKKTPVEEIDNFSFTIDGITIPVKVLVMDAPQY